MYSGQYVVHKKKIFEDLLKFFLILPLTRPQKGPVPLSEQFESPSPCFLLSLVEIGLVVLEKMF